MYLKIALPVPLRKTFDYLYPETGEVQKGARVRVPFGRRHLVGIVVGRSETSRIEEGKIRCVQQIIDNEPAVPAPLLSLLEWAASYYHHPLGETIFTALPTLIRQARSLYESPDICWTITESGRLLDHAKVKGSVQKKILFLLNGSDAPVPESLLRDISSSWRQSLKRLTEKGWIEPAKCAAATSLMENKPARTEGPKLNEYQAAAVTAISQAEGFNSYVLHGVTGSGKTEVYIRAAQQALEQGKQLLILTPEIGLTPQLTGRLERSLGVPASVLHSGLSDTERLTAWREAREGRTKLIISTRSGVFTPAPDLGMIIIDEEHDLSYKQQDGLRYNARDVALMRARRANIPIILGSATPSLESFANCQNGRHALLSLPARAGNAQPPTIHFLDKRKIPSLDGLSPQLLDAIRQTLAKNEQTLLFLNRRGYSPVLYCADCGWVAPCQRCDARLTYHKREERLRCHHCGADFPVFDHCQDCKGSNLTSVGEGTERIEEALEKTLPQARLLRIDRDSMSRKNALKNALEQIHNDEVDILVGTQMLSKGHHFPNVTLVGVINADSALYSTDFRAPERLFQLVTQVAGRAGRANKPGSVLIQTAHPEHPVYRQIAADDYAAFAESQLAERREIGYPPYRHFALLRAESVKEDAALQFLHHARELALQLLPKAVELSDAIPSPMQRRSGRWRAQLLVHSPERAALHPFLSRWLEKLDGEIRKKLNVRWSLDVDPMDMG